jgi:hypothetical protein
VFQVFKRPRASPHLWMILFAFLALAAFCLFELLTPHSLPAEADSKAEPVFSLPGGYYDHDVQLKITPPYPGTDVIFTVDGRVPTYTVGTVYTQPIRLSVATPAVTVIRARVRLPDAGLGPVVSASYFVGIRATLPMMSLIVDPDDLWSTERGIYANPDGRGQAWERPVDVTYVDKDHQAGFQIPAGVRIHGHWSRAFDKKSLRLYFRQEYGASRLEYPLFADDEVRSFKRLVLHSGGEDWNALENTNWTLMRNQLTAELALEIGGYATHSQPTLLFINGELWGIYQIRERLDRYFLADHYGIDSADFLKSPEYKPGGTILMGDRENWDHLLNFAETHDLIDPANYAYVQTQVDIPAFIDYHILEFFTANTDWPEDNINQFRPRTQGGRWRWFIWDNELGWGFSYRSSVNTNMMKRILGSSDSQTDRRDILLLSKLLKNPVFRARFLSRTADLLNTTLAPQSVTAHIDALAAELAPDIAYETARWSSSTDWESNVQDLRDFARQRPDVVRQQTVEWFGLGGTAQLTFLPPAGGSGYIAVNGVLMQHLPWEGTYFQGVPVQITAVPAPGYRFAGWEPASLPQTPVITITVAATQTFTPCFEAVSGNAPKLGDVVLSEYHVDDDSRIEGDWFVMQVKRPGGIDLRGWRVTDNDAKTATDEGSLIFTDNPAFARVPEGTTILVVATQTTANAARFPRDDLNAWDGQMVVYVGNGSLDTTTDPGFNLGPEDNLALLAPGPTHAFGDEKGIAFVAWSKAVTPASFGVLEDGVLPAPAGRSIQPNSEAELAPKRGLKNQLREYVARLMAPRSKLHVFPMPR